MGLEAIAGEVARTRAVAELASVLAGGGTATVPGPARAALVAAVAAREPGPWLVVTPGSREAERLHRELSAWAPGALLFPAWETLPHERLSPRAETVARRLAALARAREGASPPVVVAPIRAAIQPTSPEVARVEPLVVARGSEIARDELIARLAALDYRRSDMVERRGEFAARGGLVDVFPAAEDHPVRVEYFGDEIEGLRTFAVASQRSLLLVERVEIFPCRELLPTAEVRRRAAEVAAARPDLAGDLERIAEGITFEGMESLLGVLFEDPPTLRELLPEGTRVVVLDPKLAGDRATEMAREVEELRAAVWGAANGGGAPPSASGAFAPLGRALGAVPASMTAFRGDWPELTAATWESLHGNVPGIAREVARLSGAGFRVLVCGESQGAVDRIREVLAGCDLALPRLDGTPGAAAARAAVTVAPIEEGFTSEALGLVVVGEADLFGKRRPHREPRAARRRATALDLAAGDLVVHVVHGVGRYRGMETREIGDARGDYLVVEYAEGDTLYVPADQIDSVSRYIGGENPKLHRLGSSDFARQKARVRRAVRDIAGELITLYAARADARGHAHSADLPWQRELEDAFPYLETRDQLSAIDEVKADMERAAPMDRLICGDVGYGKTEIAIRAAFKSVMDAKQVAILVPTTLLAQQHYATFSERFAPFPVRVAVLSRFVRDAEQARLLDELAAGRVDVVIGTHRLLGSDIVFADLGLLVVDEEQRFGVSHKEAIKRLRTNVDVLTLTATPIPRTLEMALSGIRDLSVVDTPPEDRHPVLTYVGPHDEGQIVAAIRREMLREGQVFYVHNVVHDIDRVAGRLRSLVPDARIGVAHGQMNERGLERVMLDFWDKEFDVLVTTTIIESGLDIPTVNTLVVERADLLGLAQLYQLRGRVGRARERAYAYLFFPPERSLTETSHARLEAISQFTDLGSGLQIALRDLEIRGAGNVLGAEQHGHIATVGFDLYVRLLSEAVEEARGRAPHPKPEVTVDLPVDAHLPESWIEAQRVRLAVYRRIAEAESLEALADARAELADRFGPLPSQAETLFAVAELKIETGRRGARTISTAGRWARIEPLPLEASEQVRARRLHPGAIFKPQAFALLLPVPSPRPADLAAWLLGALRDILHA
ncbi:MAG: transcription-repair coupling factor [Acidobacteria bacterium]|nr:transcription-repair coupling factor [Acidobacteriota bacterium]